jgi:hypothetical protein
MLVRVVNQYRSHRCTVQIAPVDSSCTSCRARARPPVGTPPPGAGRVSESRQPHRLKIGQLVANIGTSSLTVNRINETEMPGAGRIGPGASGSLEAGAVQAFEQGRSVAVALAQIA